MRQFRLTIITKNQKNVDKAKKLAKLIDSTLGDDLTYEINKYNKFSDSFKIEFSGKVKNESLISQAVELTDRLSSPWLIYYDRNEDTANLIFNKSDHSNFRKPEFNVIEWSSFEIDE